MFALKKKYYLIIENITDLNLRNIKLKDKFIIIYRNNSKIKNIGKLRKFKIKCKNKRIDFYVANDFKLASTLKADGLYISAYNKNLNIKKLNFAGFKLIGSAHNIKDLNIKILQGCSNFIFSRLFETSYKFKKGYLGVVKFNLFKLKIKENLIPLGGIKLSNLNMLNLVKCNSFAVSSEIKKKPAKIFNRLF